MDYIVCLQYQGNDLLIPSYFLARTKETKTIQDVYSFVINTYKKYKLLDTFKRIKIFDISEGDKVEQLEEVFKYCKNK